MRVRRIAKLAHARWKRLRGVSRQLGLNSMVRGMVGDLRRLRKQVAAEDLISVVLVCANGSLSQCKDTVASFRKHGSPAAELVLVPGGAVGFAALEKLVRQEGADSAMSMRVVSQPPHAPQFLNSLKGKKILYLEPGDQVLRGGLTVLAHAVLTYEDTALVYSDDVLLGADGKAIDLSSKPAFDPVYLMGRNYIGKAALFDRQRLMELSASFAEVGATPPSYQHTLIFLRGVGDSEVRHVPFPSLGVEDRSSQLSAMERNERLLEERRFLSMAVSMPGQDVFVGRGTVPTSHRVDLIPDAENSWPAVHIIVPNKDAPELIERVLYDLIASTDYPNRTITIVDNGSTDPATLDVYERYKVGHGIRVLMHEEPFNFARSINHGLGSLEGPGHILLVNNDVEVQHRDWLKEMVSCLSFAGTGIVGAKLLYPDGRLQHAGVHVGCKNGADHAYLGEPESTLGRGHCLTVRHSVSCVTGAVMLISHDCALKLGQWDEGNFAVAYNDVDYCMRAHKAGFRIVWTPFATLVHRESVSRSKDRSPSRKAQFRKEKSALRSIHRTVEYLDPAHHPLLSRRHRTPRFSFVRRLPKARRWFEPQWDQ
ncbi:MAG: glycosyltransferase [Pseudomonadota bacterium]